MSQTPLQPNSTETGIIKIRKDEGVETTTPYQTFHFRNFLDFSKSTFKDKWDRYKQILKQVENSFWYNRKYNLREVIYFHSMIAISYPLSPC